MTAAEEKTRRVLTALRHEEPDRVPIGEFFWTRFLRRCKAELEGGDGFDPYRYWDLDLIVINPNMDPQLTGIEVLEDTPERQRVRTGFGAVIERRADYPMPRFLDFETKTFAQFDALQFDDPRAPARYTERLDDQINSVADTLTLGLPSFVERVHRYCDDLCVFGSVCEPHEFIWRIMGTDNVLVKMAEDPQRFAQVIDRVGDFLVGIVEGQLAAAPGMLRGLYVWGDVAYDRGLFFSPDYWRAVYKPQLARLCDAVHAAGLPVIYHGCGNAAELFDDMIEAGVDCYNPLEAKAGLDVVELKRRFGNRLAFNGNLDVTVLGTNDPEAVRREVLTKLNAAKGGGFIVQSDHSVPDDVAPHTYAYVRRLVQQHGEYPLDLGEFDLPV